MVFLGVGVEICDWFLGWGWYLGKYLGWYLGKYLGLGWYFGKFLGLGLIFW